MTATKESKNVPKSNFDNFVLKGLPKKGYV